MYTNSVGGPCHVKEEYTQCAGYVALVRLIGLDLAKADCAVAAVPCADDELGLIDRMDYESLFEQAEKLGPTLFAMEPCCGYSQISLRLQNMGHEVKVISGHAVKNWIATHKSNQKTDLNDATALAKLALYDHDLQPIRVKNVRSAGSPVSRRSESNCGHRLQNP